MAHHLVQHLWVAVLLELLEALLAHFLVFFKVLIGLLTFKLRFYEREDSVKRSLFALRIDQRASFGGYLTDIRG